MTARIDATQAAPQIVGAALKLQQAISAVGLEHKLMELVKIRASQINGCAFCLKMHTRDARKGGESEERIYLLPAWREAPLYSARERAALAWTETLTHVSERGAPDAIYDEVKRQFSPQEIAGLTAAVAMINFWNRISIGFAAAPEIEQKAAA